MHFRELLFPGSSGAAHSKAGLFTVYVCEKTIIFAGFDLDNPLSFAIHTFLTLAL
jgi:hypothetical protein